MKTQRPRKTVSECLGLLKNGQPYRNVIGHDLMVTDCKAQPHSSRPLSVVFLPPRLGSLQNEGLQGIRKGKECDLFMACFGGKEF